MLVQWLFNGCHHASCPPFSASSMNADAAAVSVSSPMSFCLLVVEIRVYLGGCFSWKAWQFFATAWQKIRMPCAVVRQGRCLDVFRDVFSFICVITTSETVGRDGKQ